jgi:hypothetical protein
MFEFFKIIIFSQTILIDIGNLDIFSGESISLGYELSAINEGAHFLVDVTENFDVLGLDLIDIKHAVNEIFMEEDLCVELSSSSSKKIEYFCYEGGFSVDRSNSIYLVIEPDSEVSLIGGFDTILFSVKKDGIYGVVYWVNHGK